MLYAIENDTVICKIESVGAEIRSLINKLNGQEYIWQIKPSVWGSSSPVLFPAIGNIKDGVISYKGEEYPLPKHGIIRNNKDLQVLERSKHKCAFSLEHSKKTKQFYPFDFKFTVVYELVGSRLIMTYHIENKDKEILFFSCGGHTAYNLPLDATKQLTDYVIEFPEHKTQLTADTLGNSGLLSYRKRHFTLENNCLELNSTLFNEDALIFAGIDVNWVRLRQKTKKKGVVVRFKGYPNLALWSKPNANYVCVEPWLGLPDREDESVQLAEKKTYRILEPEQSFSISIETEIE